MKIKTKVIIIVFCFIELAICKIINVPNDYLLIQLAINQANNSDTVIVAENTYYENINFQGKSITVASRYLLDKDTTHISNTVIDGSLPSHPDSGSVVYFISQEDTNSVLCGFTITKGTGTITAKNEKGGGGIFCINSNPKIIKNTIINNAVIHQGSGKCYGGGISVDATVSGHCVIISENFIQNNQVENFKNQALGGGLFISSHAKILKNFIHSNRVTYSGSTALNSAWSKGGGIACFTETYYLNVLLKENIISNNLSASTYLAHGGGIDFYYTNTELIQNTIVHNMVDGDGYNYGAGVRVKFSQSFSVINNNISYNTTEAPNKTNGGGLLLFRTQNVNIQQNRFSQNLSTAGGGIQEISCTNSQIIHNVFIRNQSDGGGGLAVVGSDPIIDSNFISANMAKFGGGIYILGLSRTRITNNIIVSNKADSLGGGILLFNMQTNKSIDELHKKSDIKSNALDVNQVLNNTLTQNHALYEGGAIWSDNMNVVIFNNILWNDSSNVGSELEVKSGHVWVGYSAIEGSFQGEKIINQDPQFVSGDTLYRVITAWPDQSPCLGGGVDSIQYDGFWIYSPDSDYWGNPRSMPVGSCPDIGAFESSVANTAIISQNPSVITGFQLHQNYPNPFNPQTHFNFELPDDSHVRVIIYDLLGSQIKMLLNEKQSAGMYHMTWDGKDSKGQRVSSGIYFCSVKVGDDVRVSKMVLQR